MLKFNFQEHLQAGCWWGGSWLWRNTSRKCTWSVICVLNNVPSRCPFDESLEDVEQTRLFIVPGCVSKGACRVVHCGHACNANIVLICFDYAQRSIFVERKKEKDKSKYIYIYITLHLPSVGENKSKYIYIYNPPFAQCGGKFGLFPFVIFIVIMFATVDYLKI